MDIRNLKKGTKVSFSLGETVFNTIYFGKFDFLHCFDTLAKTLPKVTVLNKGTPNATSIVIANFKLLQDYGLSIDEIRAILYHEEGHILSTGQKDKTGLDLEFDADDYAISFLGASIVISALEKTKNIIIGESKEEIPRKIETLEKRINKIRTIDKKDNIEK